MRREHDLRVVRWAGISSAGGNPGTPSIVAAADDSAIPAGIRRRMGKLERLAVRCALGVLDDNPTDELIFCSRYGNFETLLSLLRSIASDELVSPMAFSGSVHNATPGHIGQIRNERLRHTALAGGTRTLAAGLLEAYARLVCGDANDVTMIYADVAMPALFKELADGFPSDIAFAVRLCADTRGCDARIESVGEGWSGVEDFFHALEQGVSGIAADAITSPRAAA